MRSMAAHGAGPLTRRNTAEFVARPRLARRPVVGRAPAPINHGDGRSRVRRRPWSDIARANGAAGYIGDGSNRWPSVHRLDSAHLFRLAVEQAPAGSTLHAVADEGVPIRDIAEVIGRQLNLPLASVAPEDAAEHFTWLAGFIGFDDPASSALTRELLGWEPRSPA